MAVPCRNRRLVCRVSIASLPSTCHVAELPEVKGRVHMHFVDSLGIHASMKYVCQHEYIDTLWLTGANIINSRFFTHMMFIIFASWKA